MMVAITSPPAKAIPSPTSGRSLTSALSWSTGSFSSRVGTGFGTWPDLPARGDSETGGDEPGPGLGNCGGVGLRCGISGAEPAGERSELGRRERPVSAAAGEPAGAPAASPAEPAPPASVDAASPAISAQRGPAAGSDQAAVGCSPVSAASAEAGF